MREQPEEDDEGQGIHFEFPPAMQVQSAQLADDVRRT